MGKICQNLRGEKQIFHLYKVTYKLIIFLKNIFQMNIVNELEKLQGEIFMFNLHIWESIWNNSSSHSNNVFIGANYLHNKQ